MAVVRPDKLEEFLAVTERWEVETSVIGEVTSSGRLTIDHHGRRIVDVDPRTVAHDGPVYDRPYARPDWLDPIVADTAAGLARPADADALAAQVRQVALDPNQASKAWVTDQYDRYVQGRTALAQPDDAGVLRIDESTHRGVALASDANHRYAFLDPRAGAAQALVEAARNVATVGARPLAVTDCLNLGNPEDPGAMWQLVETITGLADACQEYGIPVTGGNVSLYNSTGEPGTATSSIHPTPVVGVLGLLDDVTRATPSGFRQEGETVVLLGSTALELDGSAWAQTVHGHLGGRPPAVSVAAEKALVETLLAIHGEQLATAAHDLSTGGLAQALVDASVRYGVGAEIDLTEVTGRDGIDLATALFSESQARALVVVAPEDVDRVAALAAAQGVACATIGSTGGGSLAVGGVAAIDVAALGRASAEVLPALWD